MNPSDFATWGAGYSDPQQRRDEKLARDEDPDYQPAVTIAPKPYVIPAPPKLTAQQIRSQIERMEHSQQRERNAKRARERDAKLTTYRAELARLEQQPEQQPAPLRAHDHPQPKSQADEPLIAAVRQWLERCEYTCGAVIDAAWEAERQVFGKREVRQ